MHSTACMHCCSKSSKARQAMRHENALPCLFFGYGQEKKKVKVFGSHTFLMALITWITWSVEKVSSLLYISLCLSVYIYKKFTFFKYFQFWKSSHTAKSIAFREAKHANISHVRTDSKEHGASFTTTFTLPFDPTCLSGFIFNFLGILRNRGSKTDRISVFELYSYLPSSLLFSLFVLTHNE